MTTRTKTPRNGSPSPPQALPRKPLERSQIARTALRLIDQFGIEGCSMRKLGAELEADPMAMYHHFRSKGVLLDAVVDLLVDEIDLGAGASQGTLERLWTYHRSFRQLAIRHPRAFFLIAGRRFNTEHAFQHYERVLTTYADLGLGPKEQAYWFRLIGGFVCGAGMAYVASVEHNPEPEPLRLQHAPESIALPHVRDVAPYLQIDGLEEAFEYGLAVLMKALHASLDGAAVSARGGVPAGARAKNTPTGRRRNQTSAPTA